MSVLLKLHAVIERGLVKTGECDVTDLLHGEHPGLLESFGLEVFHILSTVTFHSTHPGHVVAFDLNIPNIVIQVSLLVTVTEGEVFFRE